MDTCFTVDVWMLSYGRSTTSAQLCWISFDVCCSGDGWSISLTKHAMNGNMRFDLVRAFLVRWYCFSSSHFRIMQESSGKYECRHCLHGHSCLQRDIWLRLHVEATLGLCGGDKKKWLDSCYVADALVCVIRHIWCLVLYCAYMRGDVVMWQANFNSPKIARYRLNPWLHDFKSMNTHLCKTRTWNIP